MSASAIDMQQYREKRERLYRIRLCHELELSSARAGDYAIAEAARAMRLELEGVSI
jgi:hypothetical protein